TGSGVAPARTAQPAISAAATPIAHSRIPIAHSGVRTVPPQTGELPADVVHTVRLLPPTREPRPSTPERAISLAPRHAGAAAGEQPLGHRHWRTAAGAPPRGGMCPRRSAVHPAAHGCRRAAGTRGIAREPASAAAGCRAAALADVAATGRPHLRAAGEAERSVRRLAHHRFE